MLLGHGDAVWDEVRSAVLVWAVKTRSGFTVLADGGGDPRARAGAEYSLVARLGPIRIREPVQVVAVVDEPDRCGFAYGTLEGHPVSGEEAFVVHRAPDGGVWLTLRSLTGAGSGGWRWAFPLALVSQRWYRRRYRRALRSA